MKKLFYKIIGVLSCFIIAACLIVGIIYFGITGIYENNYQKGYVYQYRALQNSTSKERKLVLIGTHGSHVVFAVDMEKLKSDIAFPVYTLGIHSGMGFKYTIETLKKFLNSNDIVVVSYLNEDIGEYGMDLIYLTLDSEPDMFWDFFKHHPYEVIKSIGPAIYTKIHGIRSHLKNKGKEIQSVYDARAFDKHTGNMIYKRENCIASHKNLHIDNQIKFDVEHISCDCVDVLNEFSDFCQQKDVSIYMLYTAFYNGATKNNSSEIINYQNELCKKIKIPFIADISECAMPEEYVYDGIYHMNDKGKQVYTDLICRALGKHLK